MLIRGLLVLVLGGAVTSVADTGSAPIVTKYRMEASIEQVVDLSVVGQPEQRNTVDQVVLFTVTLTDSAGGKAMHVVIDSVDATGVGTPPRAVLDSAKGQWLHGYLSKDGRATISGLSDEKSDLVGQLKTSILTFHPTILGALESGAQWVDTTSVHSKTSSQDVNSVVVTSYTAAGKEQFGGTSAQRIDAKVESKGTGTIQNPGLGAMDISTSEMASRTYFLSANGRYLGGTTTGKAEASISAPALPAPIPISITRETKISVIE